MELFRSFWGTFGERFRKCFGTFRICFGTLEELIDIFFGICSELLQTIFNIFSPLFRNLYKHKTVIIFFGLHYLFQETVLEPGMVVSNEPGYYENGRFGIRVENLFVVVEKETPHRFGGSSGRMDSPADPPPKGLYSYTAI